MTTNAANQLELHVFGGAKGESLILRLPNDRWGVIDCYASDLANVDSNAAAKFLKSQNVTEIEFLCLTHPHADHYLGMSQLLDHFKVAHFWQPAAMSKEKLRYILMRSGAEEAVKSGSNNLTVAQREFENILRRVATLKSAKTLRHKPCLSNATTYPSPFSSGSSVKITVVAPCGQDIDRYEQDLEKLLDTQGRLRGRIPPSLHNGISIGLLVTFGRTRLMLGGDVERPAWENTLTEWDHAELTANCVKVSHHGSPTGYCDGLWAKLAANGKPIAIVTSFRQHRLPRGESLAHIRPFVSSLFTTRLDAIHPSELPIPLSPNAPVRSRQAIARTFNAQPQEDDGTFGRCSFVFDDNGNCVSMSFHNGAGEI